MPRPDRSSVEFLGSVVFKTASSIGFHTVAGGLPRRRCQQRLFLAAEPARFRGPAVVVGCHSRTVTAVVASDVNLTDGSELVFWRSAIRAVAGSFQESLGAATSTADSRCVGISLEGAHQISHGW